MESTASDEQLIAQLIELERARCAAISSDDRAAVDELTGDTLTYTHSTAVTEDRDAHLASLGTYPRRLSRPEAPLVRLYGDVAVMTGPVHAHFPEAGPGKTPVDFGAHALQVWVRQNGSWKQVAFASSGQLPDSIRPS